VTLSLAALAVADQNLATLEIDILNPEAHALHQAHAGVVQEIRHQAIDAVHPRQHGAHLYARNIPGKRCGCLARTTLSSQGKSINNTSLYKNSKADNA